MNRIKRIFAFITLAIILSSSLFANEVNWWDGKAITAFRYNGLQNVTESTVNSLLSPYIGVSFSDSVFNEITNLLYSQNWMEWFNAEADVEGENQDLVIVLDIYEAPFVESVSVEGNDKIGKNVLLDSQNLAKGGFFNYNELTANAALIHNEYISKGYKDSIVESEYTINEETNKVSIVYKITEGTQYKVRNILFEGISGVSEKEVSKLLTTKKKTFFNAGNYTASTVEADKASIISYYASKGYPDAQVTNVRIESAEEPKDGVEYLNIIFEINEGSLWTLSYFTFEGNEVYSDETIVASIDITEGEVYNVEKIGAVFESLSSLYYDNGYIRAYLDPIENRDEENHSIGYHVVITEGPQSVVEEIIITGLTKTKPYVLEREMAMKVGDVFSRTSYIKTQQNMMNTGLLKNITAQLYPSTTSDGVIVEYFVEEGNQMELQFGATFGGTTDSFPVSGFLQWADKNLGGTGRALSIGTTLSPSTQSVSLSLSDNWVKDKRWSNGISFSIERTVRKNELQRGIGSDYFNGRDSGTYPLGYQSPEDWAKSEVSPSSAYLMSYDYWRIALGYNTGYAFVWNPGTLSISGGISIGLNHAIYDNKNFDPYELLVKKYNDAWQFSNKLSLSLSWDGRDLKQNTTRGYMVSMNYTYAGGVLFGLSNYNKISLSAAGYHSLFSYSNDKGEKKSLVLSATSQVSFMLPQYWNSPEDGGWGWYAPEKGATKYEMLYIDGMNIGRGFNVIYDQSFLWHSQIDLTFPIVQSVLGAEAFISATGITARLENLEKFSNINWYYAAGAGIKMQIPGFPLGLYLVKNATLTQSKGWQWDGGFIFHNDKNPGSGIKLVLAITTSLY